MFINAEEGGNLKRKAKREGGSAKKEGGKGTAGQIFFILRGKKWDKYNFLKNNFTPAFSPISSRTEIFLSTAYNMFCIQFIPSVFLVFLKFLRVQLMCVCYISPALFVFESIFLFIMI